MSAATCSVKPSFEGDLAKGFILGVLRGSIASTLSVGAFKERVLWQWGNNQDLFPELMRSLEWLAEVKLIEIIGPHSTLENNSVRLLR